jgi:hypothetical protein
MHECFFKCTCNFTLRPPVAGKSQEGRKFKSRISVWTLRPTESVGVGVGCVWGGVCGVAGLPGSKKLKRPNLAKSSFIKSQILKKEKRPNKGQILLKKIVKNN